MGESHVCITVSTTSVCALSGDVSKWRDFVEIYLLFSSIASPFYLVR